MPKGQETNTGLGAKNYKDNKISLLQEASTGAVSAQ